MIITKKISLPVILGIINPPKNSKSHKNVVNKPKLLTSGIGVPVIAAKSPIMKHSLNAFLLVYPPNLCTQVPPIKTPANVDVMETNPYAVNT